MDQNRARELYEEGNRHLQRGAGREAEEAFRQALSIDPDYADAHSKLGVVLAERGDRPAACAQFERALQINERHGSALTNLGNLHFLAGDFAEAERYHRLAIASDPDNPVPHNNLAAVLKKQKKVKEFVDEMKVAQRLTRRQHDDQVRTELKAGPKRGCLAPTAMIGLITVVLVGWMLT